MDVNLVKQGIGGLVLENWALQEAVQRLTPPAPVMEPPTDVRPPVPKVRRKRRAASPTPAPPSGGA